MWVTLWLQSAKWAVKKYDARIAQKPHEWCPEPESNRYAGFILATDFKSVYTVSVGAGYSNFLAFLGHSWDSTGEIWQSFQNVEICSTR